MDRATGNTRLRQFIAEETDSLMGALRYYLSRAGLSRAGQSLDAAASELLSEVVVEALQHEARFRSAAQPRAWLLGIAANLIRRRQVELARRDRREPLVRDLYPDEEQVLSDDELFDRVASLAGAGTVDDLDAEAQIAAILGSVAPDDRQVLHLAIVHGLDGEALAHELDVTPGAARVRLHRALNRLRAAYAAQEDEVDG